MKLQRKRYKQKALIIFFILITVLMLNALNVFAADTAAPAPPTGLRAVSASAGGISITWNPSADNVGVAGYFIVRNNKPYAMVAGTAFNNTSVTAGETYSYKITAYDAAGNYSGYSNTITVTAGSLNIVAVGDIMMGRRVKDYIDQNGLDYTYPFSKVASTLKRGDVVFGNVEAPITAQTHSLSPSGKIVLKQSPDTVKGLKYAGFNAVSIANNHMMDYYQEGLFDTINALDNNGIAHAGGGKNLSDARKLTIIQKKGVKIGILAYSDMTDYLYSGSPSISYSATATQAGTAPTHIDYILNDVKNARSQVDILIVSLHWGWEEHFEVLPEQKQMAYQILNQGADMILGHHPHQYQGIEIYNGKPIVYSMGNFVFDQNDPENQEGFILEMNYANKKLAGLTATPYRIINKSQPVPVLNADASALLQRESDLSKQLGSTCSIHDNKLVFKLQ